MELTNIGQKNSHLFEEIDKKVTIKYLKEVKTNRTYIDGLTNFLQEKEINNIVKVLKKKLGAGFVIKGTSYGFQGNHTERIKELILAETVIPENKILVV